MGDVRHILDGGLNMEKWKDITGFEGFYQVSNLGRVRSMRSGKILVPQKRKSGYLVITFCVKNVPQQTLLHRVVAQNFLPNTNNLLEVNHKNGNKKDNRVINLEWTTRSANEVHAYKNGLKSHVGEKNTQSILTKKSVLKIRKLWETNLYSQKEIGDMFGVRQQTVSSIVTYKNWKHI